MNDEEIAREIQSRGLEIEYLRELAASLGFADSEGVLTSDAKKLAAAAVGDWRAAVTEAVFEAIDHSSHEQRRRAALRTLSLREEGDGG